MLPRVLKRSLLFHRSRRLRFHLLLLRAFRAHRADADLDLAGLRFGFLCKLDLEHAGIACGFYVLSIYGIRERKGAGECPVAVLNAMEVLLLLLRRELALSADGKIAAFHLDVQIFLFNARDFELQDQLMFVFVDIDRGRKAGSGQRLTVILTAAIVLKERIEPVLQGNDFTEGIPTNDCHVTS